MTALDEQTAFGNMREQQSGGCPRSTSVVDEADAVTVHDKIQAAIATSERLMLPGGNEFIVERSVTEFRYRGRVFDILIKGRIVRGPLAVRLGSVSVDLIVEVGVYSLKTPDWESGIYGINALAVEVDVLASRKGRDLIMRWMKTKLLERNTRIECVDIQCGVARSAANRCIICKVKIRLEDTPHGRCDRCWRLWGDFYPPPGQVALMRILLGPASRQLTRRSSAAPTDPRRDIDRQLVDEHGV